MEPTTGAVLYAISWLVKLLSPWLRRFDVSFHQPESPVQEKHLVFWQIPVSRKHKMLSSVPLQDVSADLIVHEPISRTFRLCWRGNGPPQERITLFWGETNYITVVARTTSPAGHLLAVTAAMVIPPGAFNWGMRPGIPRIVDIHHCLTFQTITDLAVPGRYRATLQLRVGNKEIAKNNYLIEVPPADAPNDHFRLLPQ